MLLLKYTDAVNSLFTLCKDWNQTFMIEVMRPPFTATVQVFLRPYRGWKSLFICRRKTLQRSANCHWRAHQIKLWMPSLEHPFEKYNPKQITKNLRQCRNCAHGKSCRGSFFLSGTGCSSLLMGPEKKKGSSIRVSLTLGLSWWSWGPLKEAKLYVS